MIVAIPVGPDGRMGHSWGKARTVAVAEVVDGAIAAWQEHEVRWDELHDTGSHGSHHARVVTFLRDNQVQSVVVDHVGEGMRRMLTSMGVALHEGRSGDAREQVRQASAR